MRTGFATTIVEHNLALGGVCTAWHRGSDLVDGCIQWLSGGPFDNLHKELGILPAVPLRVQKEFGAYHHTRDGWEVSLGHDLANTEAALRNLAPDDASEMARQDGGRRATGGDNEVIEIYRGSPTTLRSAVRASASGSAHRC